MHKRKFRMGHLVITVAKYAADTSGIVCTGRQARHSIVDSIVAVQQVLL